MKKNFILYFQHIFSRKITPFTTIYKIPCILFEILLIKNIIIFYNISYILNINIS